MPTLERLADNGLTYTQWHTTALCSPTRSTFLTGRNHHVNGMASITEGANGFPGANGRIPAAVRHLAQILQDNGWSTFWLGKNHNVPEQDVASGASRRQWPLQKGFDRFYGFLGGETNQWYPDLVEDNRFIEQPYGPEEGYHLSKDLADKAICDDPRPEGQQPLEALVHVVLPRRQPRPAPSAPGVHRQVQGQVRRRLRGLPRVGRCRA